MRRLTFLLAFLLTSALVYSQVGIKGGATFSSIASSPEDVNDENIKIGFHGGVIFKLPVHDWVAVQPEVLYTRKGAKYNFLGTKVESRLDYIDIPVLAVFEPFGGPVNVHIGPQFSYLVDVEYKYFNDRFNESGVVDDDRDNYNSWDLGLAAGVGLTFEKFFVEVRYNRGFRNLEQNRTIQEITFEEGAKNYNIQASVGVFF